MDSTKIGSKEAIALIVTIVFNHIIVNVTTEIISTTGSASLLNLLYVGIITIIFACIVCYFLNKFPTYDLIDISRYLGGNVLKWIVGIIYITYFTFFSGALLHMFASCLQIIYFPLTQLYYIILIFVIAALIASNFNYNAIFRSTLIFFPVLIFSLIFLFASNIPFYKVDRIYPIWGKGIYTTFVTGLSNMFAFQGITCIYFLPPMLKEPDKIKKIAIHSIIWSCIFLIISIAIILFMFHSFLNSDELMPLFSAVKYIEFGSFFRKLDSLFILIWIISFTSFLSIALKFSSTILNKLLNTKKNILITCILAIALFLASIWQKNYAETAYFVNSVYKYAFFIQIIGINLFILILATIKQTIRKWFK